MIVRDFTLVQARDVVGAMLSRTPRGDVAPCGVTAKACQPPTACFGGDSARHSDSAWGPRKHGAHVGRAGITLLEVVIALAIFLMSLVAIMQLVSFGSERSTDVKMQSRASMLCQRELNKRIAGVEPLSGNSTTLSADDSAWQCDVEVSDAEVTGVKRVRVTVKRDLEGGRVAEATLTQLVLDPSLRGSTQDIPGGLSSTPSTTEPGTESGADAGGNTNTGNSNGGNNKSGGNAKSNGGNTKGGNTKGGGTKGGGTPNTGKGGAGPRGGPGSGGPGGGFGPGGGGGPGRTGGFGPGPVGGKGPGGKGP